MTMLVLDGEIGFAREGLEHRSYLEGTMTPFNGSSGNALEISIEPNFSDLRYAFDVKPDIAALYNSFAERNGKFVRGRPEISIYFPVPMETSHSKLVYTSYNIRDDSGEIVASIPVPLFLPTAQ